MFGRGVLLLLKPTFALGELDSGPAGRYIWVKSLETL